MTLEQFIETRKAAIRVNYQLRNCVNVFYDVRRQKRLKANRRASIRQFIKEVRACQRPVVNPELVRRIGWMLN